MVSRQRIKPFSNCICVVNFIISGQIDFFDPAFDSEMIFKGCGALVFVIDARDDYIEALTKLNKTVLKAHAVNKQIKFEVFIHKVDGISDDLKMETQRDIVQRASDDLVSSNHVSRVSCSNQKVFRFINLIKFSSADFRPTLAMIASIWAYILHRFMITASLKHSLRSCRS